jgi:hypothetical protein
MAADVPVDTAWTDDRFDAAFEHAGGSTDLLEKLRKWAGDHDIALRYGGGKAAGPLYFDVRHRRGNVTLFHLDATGSIEWVFRNNLDQTAGFAHREARVALVGKLQNLFGVERPDERADTWLSLDASKLSNADQAALLSLLDEQLAVIHDEPTELFLRYQRLLGQVLSQFKELRPGATSTKHAAPQNWLSFTAGRAGFAFAWSTAYQKYFRAELYIDVGDQSKNEQYLEALQERGPDLEAAIGQPIAWERLETKRGSRLAIYHAVPGEDFDSNTELVEWAAQTMARLVDVLGPIVKAI